MGASSIIIGQYWRRGLNVVANSLPQAGARVESSPTHSNIVLGIKETPLSELKDPLANFSRKPLDTTAYNDQTHLMFSHTAKGQPYNTPLLSHFVAPLNEMEITKLMRPRLIDYELLTNGPDGKRTVGFGWFAGGKYHVLINDNAIHSV